MRVKRSHDQLEKIEALFSFYCAQQTEDFNACTRLVKWNNVWMSDVLFKAKI